jgi:hypothetical protein
MASSSNRKLLGLSGTRGGPPSNTHSGDETVCMGIYEGNRSVSQGFFPLREGIDNVQSDLCSWQLTEGVVASEPAGSNDRAYHEAALAEARN